MLGGNRREHLHAARGAQLARLIRGDPPGMEVQHRAICVTVRPRGAHQGRGVARAASRAARRGAEGAGNAGRRVACG